MLLSIEKLIYGGDGLARTAVDENGRSLAVFVPFVLPGEKIDAELKAGRSGFSRVIDADVVEPSPNRIDARCQYFQRCGGCHYQHIPYELQLKFKAEILRETLARVAKIELPVEIKLHQSPAWNYRNRTRLQVRLTPEFAVGYFKFASHEFLPVSECPISSPLLNTVIKQMIELRGCGCLAGIEEIELFADAEDERLLAWAYCSSTVDVKKLTRWGESLQREIGDIAGITFFSSRQKTSGFRKKQSGADDRNDEGDDEPMRLNALASCGATSIQYRTRESEYRVSAGAFFQVNRPLVDDLVSVVTGGAEGDIALDLYSGVGLFSAVLARRFRHIFGVEASLTSIGDFRHNVPANVKAISARTEDYLQGDLLRSGALRSRPDLIVLDPPRSGVGKKATQSLADLGAPMIRYVSCDPATLARDLAPLIAAGYRIEGAHLFDLFPETFHIESVMLLAR